MDQKDPEIEEDSELYGIEQKDTSYHKSYKFEKSGCQV